ncbi:MAG TPA: AtpZ/AtpI family protein [Cytophagaceae bacterium]|nr:AtpZ/AtpI family protein [Cytophagaceae bacterium]
MELEKENNRTFFSKEVKEKEERKLKVQKEQKRSPWNGFGLFGIIGWSIVTPIMAGVSIGIWLDKSYPQTFSWTLTLLMTGLITGCTAAWHWIKKEEQDMYKN